ncbi:MAG: hypothetical protein ABIA74_05790 [bacterium]
MRILKTIFVSCIIFSSINCAVKKDAEKEVFGRWTQIQQIFSDVNIEDMGKYLNSDLLSNVKSKCYLHANLIKTLSGFFHIFPEYKTFNLLDFEDKEISNANFKKYLRELYGLLQNDVLGFVAHLKDLGFVEPMMNFEEEEIGSSLIINKYTELFELLFDHKDYLKKYQFLFATANRFYDFCFSPKTFPVFEELVSNEDSHPIVRMLYSVMWFYLASQGWKHWHQGSIDELKKVAQKGYEIVYIAGGVDIYQLIKNGIYNITVIDPLLPSQPKYYSEGWNWIWKGGDDNGGIGDEIEFNFSDRKILMKRTKFEEKTEVFKARLSTGYVANIAKSITTWDVLDGKSNQKLGMVTYQRRFVEQEDFEIKDKQQLLISFNELHFITLPDSFGGWGVNPYKFNENLSIIVKQLSKPVTAKMVQSMRKVIEDQKFRFTELGTCVT